MELKIQIIFLKGEVQMDNKRLNEEIERRFDELQKLKAGSEEQSRATDDLVKLIKLRSDICAENETVTQQKFDTWAKMAIAGVGFVGTLVSLGIYTKLFHEGLEFEKNGTVASSFVKGAINLFKPKII